MVCRNGFVIDYNFVRINVSGTHFKNSSQCPQVDDRLLRTKTKARPKEGLALQWVNTSSAESQYDYQEAVNAEKDDKSQKIHSTEKGKKTQTQANPLHLGQRPTCPAPGGSGHPTQESNKPHSTENAPDLTTLRMLNLPLVLCHSATGSPFYLPLDHVQRTAAAQRLGAESFEEAKALLNSLLSAPHHHVKHSARGNGRERKARVPNLISGAALQQKAKAQGHGATRSPIKLKKISNRVSSTADSPRRLRHAHPATPRQPKVRGGVPDLPGNAPQSNAGLPTRLTSRKHGSDSSHLNAAPCTTAADEGLLLAGNQACSVGYAEGARTLHVIEEHDSSSGAVDWEQGVSQFPAATLLSMPPQDLCDSNTGHGGAQTAGMPSSGRGLLESDLNSGASSLTTTDISSASLAPKSKGASKRGMKRNGKSMNRRPVVDWGASFEAVIDDSGGDTLDVTELSDLHAYAEESTVQQQGGNVYEAKCRELGIPVSAAVAEALNKTHAGLARAYIGRHGARALGHALACNTCIESLDLTDNSIDGQATVHIVRGLLAAAGVTPPTHLLRSSSTDPDFKPKPDGGPAIVDRTASVWTQRAQYSKKTDERNLPSTGQIQSLVLSANLLGSIGARCVASLLDPALLPFQLIRVLELSDCGIPDSGGVALAHGLAASGTVLERLVLSKNMLGNAAATALGSALRRNRRLTSLDVSWNRIKAAGAGQLASALTKNTTLASLNIAWNGLENQGCILLAQSLQSNLGLKELDMSNTQLGTEGAIVLAQVLSMDNSTLKRVHLSGNDIGEAGGWHLMCALTTSTYLEHLGVQGATFLPGPEDGGIVTCFNPMHPQGRHTLDLSRPAERAIAIIICRLDQASKVNSLKAVILDGKPKNGGIKQLDWPKRLPAKGKLEVEFSGPVAAQDTEVLDGPQLENFVSNLRKRDMSDNERLSLVVLFGLFRYFTAAQAALVVSSFGSGDEKASAAAMLFTRIVDYDNLHKLTGCLGKRELELAQQRLGWLSAFRCDNPTGHYELNLAVTQHRHLVYRLVNLAHAEGTALTWRNISCDNLSMHASAGPPDSWQGAVPQQGLLLLDFTTSVRPSPPQIPMDNEALENLLFSKAGIRIQRRNSAAEHGFETSRPQVGGSDSEAAQRLCALRALSPHMSVSAVQVCSIIRQFQASEDRIEAAVMLYPRLVDPENVWKVLYTLKGIEQALLMTRLGMPAAFNAKRCSLHFQLDVKNPEHAEVAHKLVDMAIKALTVQNWHNVRIGGRLRVVPENGSMWALLTTESFTPHLEFDFLGTDAPELAGYQTDRWEASPPGEKIDVLLKLALRMESTRTKQLHPMYRPDEGSAAVLLHDRIQRALTVPSGQALLNAPMDQLLASPPIGHSQPAKSTPWAACWRRALHQLILLSGSSSSPVREMFNRSGGGQGKMTFAQMQELMAANGFSKAEIVQAEREIQKALGEGEARAGTADDVSPRNPPLMTGSSTHTLSSSSDKPRSNAGLVSSQTLISWKVFETIWLMELVPGKAIFD